MQSTIIDNSSPSLKMSHILKEGIKDHKYNQIRIATGYWDIPGTALLVSDLDAFLEREGTKLKILIGKDPLVYANLLKNPKYKSDKYPGDYIRTDISELDLKEEYIHVAELLIRYGEAGKIEIRRYDEKKEGKEVFLHSKCYIFSGKDDSFGIIGSSNLTKKGLEDNAELNYLESDSAIITAEIKEGSAKKGHEQWFEEKWALGTEWTKEFLEQILKPSPIAPKMLVTPASLPEEELILTPRDLYYKYLLHHLGNVVSREAHSELKSFLPETFTPITYQLDAVLQCFYIMKRHGGFMLADVVGLGKTVVGSLIIKKFLVEATTLARKDSVLVVCPPSVLKAWKETLQKFLTKDEMGSKVAIVSSGKLITLEDSDEREETEVDDGTMEETKKRDYGLVLVDESHNFRNRQSQRSSALDSLIGEVELETGCQPFVGLLSATPMNNKPEDLKQQILLFQRDGNRSTLSHIKDGRFISFMNEKQKEFSRHNHSNAEEDKKIIREISDEIRAKVLDDLVVRRTRTDIKKGYPEDAAKLRFPKIEPPHPLHYKMDDELIKLFADTVQAIIGEKLKEEAEENDEISSYEPISDQPSLGFYRWAAIMYFKDPEITKKYEQKNQTVAGISAQLANMYRIMLIKRLESSFEAFKESLRRVKTSTENMIEMLERGKVYILPDYDLGAIVRKHGSLQGAIPELDAKVAKKKDDKNVVYDADAFKDEYRELLKKDLDIVSRLVERWEMQKEDPKFEAFKELAWTKLFDDKINNPHGYDDKKLVIFTEALPTVERLEDWFKKQYNSKGKKEYRALAVKADNRKELEADIRANFDANLPDSEQAHDYNVLITTEVLAEGVNLHRANVLLNYDTPWNATRLMQRIGRINRIGSKEDAIHVFNFFPSKEGNDQILLLQLAHSKLQAFHNMFGEDSQILSDDELLPDSAHLGNLIDGDDSPLIGHITALREFEKDEPERYRRLAELPFFGLGGRLSGEGIVPMAALRTEGKSFVDFAASPTAKYGWQPIPALEAMDRLQGYASLSYAVPLTEEDAEAAVKSIRPALTAFEDGFRTAAGQSPAVRKGLTILHNCLKPLISDPADEMQGLFKLLRQKVEAENSFIIRKLETIAGDFPNFTGSYDGRKEELRERFKKDFRGLLALPSDPKDKPRLAYVLLKSNS